jgi:hypothetical protein
MTTHENFHRREYPFRSLLALVVTAIIFSAAVTSAQTYQKAAGRSMDEDARYHPIELLANGMTIQVSTSINPTNGSKDIMVIKRNVNGTQAWAGPVFLGRNDADEFAYDVVESFDNVGASDGYVIVGAAVVPPDIYSSDTDVYVAKVGVNGNILWQYTYGDPNYYEVGYAIARRGTTGYVIAGVRGQISTANSKDMLFLTINGSGGGAAAYKIGASDVDDGAYGINYTSNLDCALVGFTMSNGKTDGVLVRVDPSNGSLYFNLRRYGSSSNNDTLFSVENLGTTGYLVAGTVGYSSTLKDMWAMQLSASTGIPTWGNTYNFLTTGSSYNSINLGADIQVYGTLYMLMGTTAQSTSTSVERDIAVTKLNTSDGSPALNAAKYYGASTSRGKYAQGYGLRVTNLHLLIGGIENFAVPYPSSAGKFDNYLIRTSTALSSGCNEGAATAAYNPYNSYNSISPGSESVDITAQSRDWSISSSAADSTLCVCLSCTSKRTTKSGTELSTVGGMLNVYSDASSTGARVTVSTDDRMLGLEIFDADGNLVRTLADASTVSDEYTWNGTDDRGALVPSGVYFVRLRTDKQVETAQMRITR